MKKLKYLSLAFLVASLLAIPAAAQKHGMGRMRQTGQMSRRNNSGPRKDKEKGKQNPDRDKGKGKAKGETQGQHKGHR